MDSGKGVLTAPGSFPGDGPFGDGPFCDFDFLFCGRIAGVVSDFRFELHVLSGFAASATGFPGP